MGVSGWWNGLSNNFTELVSPVADLRDLYGFEIYYNFALTKWAYLSDGRVRVVASLQQFHRPSASRLRPHQAYLSADLQLNQGWEGDDLAVIPGARLVIEL
jgi:hypothetical protein